MAPSEPHRVLLLRPDHVGDVLLSAPAVALVRASLPRALLTYLVGPWSADAAAHGPPVDELRTLAYPGFTRRPNLNVLAPYALLAGEAARLRAQHYSLAIVLRPDHWWGALLVLAAGIPLRVGSLTPETAPLLTHGLTPTEGQHAADQAIGLARFALAAVGVVPVPSTSTCQFHVSDAARTEAVTLLQRWGLGSQRIVAIHPAAGAPLKSWPVERWARLSDALVDHGIAVFLAGAPGDGPLLSAIQARTAHVTAKAFGQSLDVSAAIYQRCSALVTVDSGAGHLAAAVGTPTVRLYGPAPPSVFGPQPTETRQHILITNHLKCAPCGYLESPPCAARATPACMLALGIDDVLNAIRSELDQG
jgi:ADP-heptose:LPS heptosyltransferase